MTTKHYLLTLLICFCYTITWGQVDPYPDDSLEGELDIRTMGPPSVPIACNITTLDFQEVLVGESVTRKYRIRNIGNDVLYIDDIEIIGSSDFSFTSNLSSPYGENILKPGQQGSLFITFGPSSSGEKNAQIIIRSSDEDEGVCGFDLEGDGYQESSGELQVSRNFNGNTYDLPCGLSTLHLPGLLPGETQTTTYIISNIGTDPLFFNGIVLEGSPAYSISYNFSFDGSPFEIASGESVTYDITYAPTSPGEQEATYYIYSSDESQNPCSFQVYSGGYEGTPGQLQVRTTAGDYPSIPLPCGQITSEFPDLIIGNTHTRTYIMRNVGTLPLYFNGITLEGSQDFSVSYNFPFTGSPVEIAGGESLTYNITFAPSSAGEKDATYYISTSDENQDPCVIQLEGGGLAKKIPALAIFDHLGNAVPCGGTIHFDLSESNPHPVLFGFYFTFRNYGTSNLSVGGTVSIQGVPGSSQSIDNFSVETLEWIFLNTTVYLPGHQITTLVYTFNTNDPNQPFCTIYVEINQLHKHGPGPYPGPVDTKSKPTIQSVGLDKNNGKNGANSNLPKLTYETARVFMEQSPRLYPTVSHDQITLVTNTREKGNYQILDMKGQIVSRGQTQGDDKTRIKIGSLTSGMYLIRLEGYPEPLRFIKR